MSSEIVVRPTPFQEEFLFSERRFPALIAGVGTGKTYMLLLKVWRYLMDNPGAVGMLIRKEYTDMRDSTVKDFERYFGVGVDTNKEFKFSNGSVLMFRHGAEINVLKNVTLDIAGIEQAEEFETDETFTYLRDRMRGTHGKYQQILLISNASGHNWIWRRWINNKISDEYHAIQACSFDNAINLPKSFIADLRAMEIEAPNHYRQYVLNCHETMDADDLLLEWSILDASTTVAVPEDRILSRVMGLDVARYGKDSICWLILEQRSALSWAVVHIEEWKDKEKDNILMRVVGKTAELKSLWKPDLLVIDDDGVGGGVVDRMGELGHDVARFNANVSSPTPFYERRKDDGWFALREMLVAGRIRLPAGHALLDELMTVRFKYSSNGKKTIVSKDEMRRKGLKSPNIGDALMMAAWGSSQVEKGLPRANFSQNRLPAYGMDDAEDPYSGRGWGQLPRWGNNS